MVKLVPECVNCGSPVTDSLESEVEEQGQLKRGKYVNSVWMCNECAEREEKESHLLPLQWTIKEVATMISLTV